ncbi:HlyD family secretion protein [Synechococcus sp. CBW1004]|uniref:HlyD family secretion protein n=1 Tax=Synechococcus sp. CBW1004 TaxID=1353136 RepID=UPI0018CD7DC6|nr:HlyD family efflux transporter periplasmic adaptor subunit [Synechococcus sp. CBW1004]QPN62858.1 HlyD family secretion protein [Synechococcus sp. CBW1004]
MNQNIDSVELQDITPATIPGRLTLRDEEGLAELKFDEYIPSIQPWMKISSLMMVSGFLAAIAFMAVCPYRVVVRAVGNIRPAGELSVINSPFEGRLHSINVSTNQAIDAGQVVVTLDQSDMQARLQEIDNNIKQISIQAASLAGQSEAEYGAALVEVEKNRAQLKLAESEYRRFRGLMATGAASIQQLEEREAAYNIAKAGFDKSRKLLGEIQSRSNNLEAQLKRDLVTQEASAAKIRRDLGYTQVRSPIRGTVFKLDVRSPGQTISIGQPIASIAPKDVNLVIKAIVQSEEISNVKVGQPAILKITGCPHPDFGVLKAKVTSIAPDALGTEMNKQSVNQQLPANSGYEVRLQPDKTYLVANTGLRCQLKIGMDLSADITIRNEAMLMFLLRKARIVTGS